MDSEVIASPACTSLSAGSLLLPVSSWQEPPAFLSSTATLVLRPAEQERPKPEVRRPPAVQSVWSLLELRDRWEKNEDSEQRGDSRERIGGSRGASSHRVLTPQAGFGWKWTEGQKF